MTSFRPLLRKAAYRSGVLSLVRHGVRQALTAIMLHRVVDPADPDFPHDDPTYTVSAPLFDQFLDFVQDHYTVVDIHQVMQACAGAKPLPEHAMLITFDDGWADNLRYAAPLLQAHSMPAIIFVAAEAVLSDSMAWWHEQIFAADRSGLLTGWLENDTVRKLVAGKDTADAGMHPLEVVTRLAKMEPDDRAPILATLPSRPCHSRMMLRPDELPKLASFGIDVGVHGYRHVPLTAIDDVQTELSRSREAIACASQGAAVTTALGCPHGRYNERVVAGAHAAGIKLVFTSDEVLNTTRNGMLTTDRPFGRVAIPALAVQSSRDRLDRGKAARWLWDRKCQ